MTDTDLWKIAKHEYVEIELVVGQVTNRINLPDLKNLRNVHLRGLSFYTDQNFINGITNIPVLPITVLNEAWLTLQLYNGKEFTHQIPLQALYQVGGAINFNYQNFLLQRVNWPKSYIDFNVTPVITENRVIPFSIYYNDKASIEVQDGTYGFRKKA